MPRQIKNQIKSFINIYDETNGISWKESEFEYIHELLLYVMSISDSDIAKMDNSYNVKKYISENTIGLSDEDINVVGYYLSYVEGSR